MWDEWDDDDDDDLPEFQTRKVHDVMPFITQIFGVAGGSALLKLIPYDDGSFRAIFKSTFFALQEGQTEATKSQWSTLKKRMKRHDRRVFVFKEHGETNCEDAGANVSPARDYRCYYLDFGFFAH